MTYEPTLEFARRLDEADPLRAFRQRFALPRGAAGRAAGVSVRALARADAARRPRAGHRGAGRLGAARRARARARAAGPGSRITRTSATVSPRLTGARADRGRGDELADGQPASAAGRVLPPERRAAPHPHRGGRLLLRPPCGRLPDRLAGPRPGARRWWSCRRPRARTRFRRNRSRRTSSEHGGEVALVLWPGVQYRTGQAFDLGRIARAAHRAGCVAGFDLAHAIGNMPLALHDIDADFAVWCSYKYLNAGPGAIGGCFVHERHDRPHLAGWWGHEPATRFRMGPEFTPPPAPRAGRSATRRSSRPLPSSPRSRCSEQAGMPQAAAQIGGAHRLPGISPRPPGAGRSSSSLRAPCDSRGCQLSVRIAGRRRTRTARVRGSAPPAGSSATGASPIRSASRPFRCTTASRTSSAAPRRSRRPCDTSRDASRRASRSTSSAPAWPARCSPCCWRAADSRSTLYDRRPDPRLAAE